MEPERGNEVINIEWGDFDRTKRVLPWMESVDGQMDLHTVNRGQYLSEKMISGMYTGEIARIIAVNVFEDKLMKLTPEKCVLLQRNGDFNGYQVTRILKAFYNFGTEEGMQQIVEMLRGDGYVQ